MTRYGAAWEMIRFSVNIMRGCFGGCSFCSITEHEGRIIQNRSEQSILREIVAIRDQTPGFTGPIYTHRATRDLCRIMLKDACFINEKDAEWDNRKRERKGLQPDTEGQPITGQL